MGAALLVLCVLSGDTSQSIVWAEKCDVIEINIVYNADGNYVFTQMIFWDYYEDGQKHVREWVSLKDVKVTKLTAREKELNHAVQHEEIKGFDDETQKFLLKLIKLKTLPYMDNVDSLGSHYPLFNYDTKKYQTFIRHNGTYYNVSAPAFFVNRTQYDVELEDRKELNMNERVKFLRFR